MKASFRTKYGHSEVLSIKNLATPSPKDDEVLIRIHAATVNRSDCHVLWGKPYIMRLFTGLTRPRLNTTGCDFAGEIKAVGNKLSSFKAGDKVIGFGGTMGCGSHAEYLILPEKKAIKCIVALPRTLSYEEAAACIEGGFYAQEVINFLKPTTNQKAMVIGATGAIGSATVQFLKSCGVRITAVCRKQNAALVKELGADRIIDYETADFKRDTEKYDYVFDSVGKTTFGNCKHLLNKKGVFTSSGGNINHLLMAIITPWLGGKKVLFRAPMNIKRGLNFLKEQIEQGKFKPVIDKKFPLEKIAEAFDYVATGQKIGNVVLSMRAEEMDLT